MAQKHPLAGVGVESEETLSLLMPDDYLDCTAPRSDFTQLSVGEPVLLEGRIDSQPTKRWPKNKKIRQPIFIFTFTGSVGAVEFAMFGDCEKFVEKTVGQGTLYFHGTVDRYQQTIQLKDPYLVKPSMVGRIVPLYPGTRGVMKADRVTTYMHSRAPKASGEAAKYLRETFKLSHHPDKMVLGFCDTYVNDFQSLFQMVHAPSSMEEAQHAINVLETISALYIGRQLSKSSMAASGPEFSIPISQAMLTKALEAVPFDLVEDQRQAVQDMVESLLTANKTHHLINGDVGSGKTITFLVVAVAAAMSGTRVAIMSPNGPLAKQTFQELETLWPGLSKQFVNGETPKNTPLDQSIIVGTQALCHRLSPEDGIDLVIIDEQQRYSVEQREGFLSSGGNLIEATATCIPRTMALLQFGGITMSHIHTKHSDKTIHTRLLTPEDNRRVFAQVKAYIEAGDRVLVVYPLKEGRDIEGEDFDKSSIIESFEIWNRCFPEKAHMLHGNMAEEEKARIIQDLREKNRQLLVSTTVVEVGINIPDLKYCVVVDPERAGLVTLHQIRGRLVRNGGVGHFDMFPTEKIGKKTIKRLNVLVDSNDGFEIAEKDLELRGAGDLKKGSESQSGKSNGLLINQPINVEYVKFFLEYFKKRAAKAA
jgi:ATP-dependent DNA helicase RecG